MSELPPPPSAPPPPPPSGPPPGYWPPVQDQPGWGSPTASWGAPTAPPQPGYGYAPPGWTYVAPTYATRLGRENGGFWERFAAALLDGLIFTVAMVPFYILAFGVNAASWETYDTTCTDFDGRVYACEQLTDATAVRLGLTFLVGFVIMMVASCAYYGYFEGRRGATPGKRIVGLEVVRAETGQYIGFGRAVGRFFARSFLSGFFYLGYLWMLWDGNKQTWHDKIVSSIVVKAQR